MKTRNRLRGWRIALLAAICGAGSIAYGEDAIPGLSPELAPPVRVEANGKPIDVEVGHAAPFYGDFTGNGHKDLLVGQFGDGKLRIYHNTGSNKTPAFGDFSFFQNGADTGVVPAG